MLIQLCLIAIIIIFILWRPVEERKISDKEIEDLIKKIVVKTPAPPTSTGNTSVVKESSLSPDAQALLDKLGM